MERYVTVKNLNGTSDNLSDEGSWKEFWEQKKGVKFSFCSCKSCLNKAEVGAHVIKTGSVSKDWYIVPLCKKCNNTNEKNEFQVKKDDLVPVN
jgi:hypothetical protein